MASEEVRDFKTENGEISVTTQHIFPIIKKWLYSDKEIFLREIVSNACDAVTKLRRLVSLGEAKDIPDEGWRVDVVSDEKNGTITVSDNGIGMSAEEVKKYICQIALSGALEFIEKYETTADGDNNSASGIIGHFGLGFYSAFMVSDKVDIITQSFDGSSAVRWTCDESGSYEMNDSLRPSGHGTDVILHISEDEKEFLSESKIREILDKYCAFMPVEIYYKTADHVCKEPDKDKDGNVKPDEEQTPCSCKKPVNDIHPLWTKNPSDCTDDEYKDFYRKVFMDWKEPLFHIHLNADYPLNFKGIIYFPRFNTETDQLEGQIKLYYNQVFVADNIKEVIPEYLLMLKGVLDCPELPLNVSRSYLQNSGYVAKISNHITKKVGDKIVSMFKEDRANFEKLWPDMKIFIEYGCLRDKKFYDRVKDVILLPVTDGKKDAKYVTVQEYLDAAKEKHENTVYYTNSPASHAAYIAMYQAQGIEVVDFDRFIDTQFINVIEQDKNVKFLRVDADVAGALKDDSAEKYDNEKLTELFKKVSGNDKLEVKYESLRDPKTPLVLNIDESGRRMDEMMKMYRMHSSDGLPDMGDTAAATLVVNSASPLVKKLAETLDETVASQMYTLALLSQRQLTSDELVKFLERSFELLEKA
ncbi:MAG: molecular chaperone HtpG [Clostridiales bacterium]|nr:molecular chaperone HtpG [Clostridiales bacterium]